MTGEVIIIEEAVVLETANPVIHDRRWLGLFLFAGLLMLLINLADPAVGLINIPVSFFLKNRLHLAAHEQAMFRLAIGAPLFISFALGFLRDRWSPFGVGDRGHFMLFGGITALIYIVIAFLPPGVRRPAGRHGHRDGGVSGRRGGGKRPPIHHRPATGDGRADERVARRRRHRAGACLESRRRRAQPVRGRRRRGGGGPDTVPGRGGGSCSALRCWA